MSRIAVGLVGLATLAFAASARAQTAAPPAAAPPAAAAPAPAAAAPPAAAPSTAPPATPAGNVAIASSPNGTASDATPSAAAPQPAAAEQPKSETLENGLISPNVRIGAGIGGGISTRPVTINAMARINRTWGVGAEYKFLPSLTFNDSGLSAYQLGVDLRWFPGHGSFFLGAALGYQDLKGTLAGSTGVAFAEEVSSLYVTPRVGWLWTWDFGLALGLDIGVTVPIAPSTSGLGDGDKLDSAMKTFGKLPLPDINLLRIGVML